MQFARLPKAAALCVLFTCVPLPYGGAPAPPMVAVKKRRCASSRPPWPNNRGHGSRCGGGACPASMMVVHPPTPLSAFPINRPPRPLPGGDPSERWKNLRPVWRAEEGRTRCAPSSKEPCPKRTGTRGIAPAAGQTRALRGFSPSERVAWLFASFSPGKRSAGRGAAEAPHLLRGRAACTEAARL